MKIEYNQDIDKNKKNMKRRRKIIIKWEVLM